MTTTIDLIGPCAICRRRHVNIGYAPSERAQVKWVCDDCMRTTTSTAAGPQPLIKKVYHMPRRELDRYEEQALEAGGDAGGAYLDSIGKTDLAALEEDEWKEFLRRVFVGYTDGMRELAKGEVVF